VPSSSRVSMTRSVRSPRRSDRFQAIFFSESRTRALSASSSPARPSTATSARSSSWAACSQAARRKISAVMSLPSGAMSTPSGAGASEGVRREPVLLGLPPNQCYDRSPSRSRWSLPLLARPRLTM
jgi:hypothetical protein